MDASIADLLCFTNDGTRPTRATLSATKAIGATFLQTNGLTGWTGESAVHFTMFRTDPTKIDAYGNPLKIAGSQSDWKGIKNGNNIEQLQLKAGSDDNYPAGSVVVCAPTSAWADDLMMGLTVQHDKQGGHKAITATSVTSNGLITGTNGLSITGGSVSFPTGAFATQGVPQIIGRNKLTAQGQSVDVFITSPKKYMRIIANARMSGGSSIVQQCIRFNDDNANNYAQTFMFVTLNNDNTGTPNYRWSSSESKFDLDFEPAGTDVAATEISLVNNVLNGQKTFQVTGSYGGYSPAAPNPPFTSWGHWTNSAVINKITLFNNGANTNGFAVDTEVIVLGWD